MHFLSSILCCFWAFFWSSPVFLHIKAGVNVKDVLRSLKVAQNSFQQFPRRRFWWAIITNLYQLMPQSWYQKTAQSLVNTLVSFSWHNRLPQEPITRSLHTNCTLESTLSRIFLFLELWYLRGFFNFPRKHADVRIIEILSCGLHVTYYNRRPQLSYEWLL